MSLAYFVRVGFLTTTLHLFGCEILREVIYWFELTKDPIEVVIHQEMNTFACLAMGIVKS